MQCHNKAILRECDIHLVRLSNDGTVKWGMPCEMCTKILNKYHVRRVIVYYEKVSQQMQEYENEMSGTDSDTDDEEIRRVRRKKRRTEAIAHLQRHYGRRWRKYLDHISYTSIT